MTAPKPNAELAYQVIDHIDAHPEQWRQGLWIGQAQCGTIACFAGWTVLLSGFEPDYADGRTQPGGMPLTERIVADDHATSVSFQAQQLLRADRWVREGHEDEEDLFDGYNSREDLGRLVAEIFGPRPEPTS